MIRIDGLCYAVGSFALKEVSLRVRAGEYFVLLGRTGSGKTLLVECLCGLNRVGAGQIRIAGRDVTRLEPRERGIGYLPQDYALFPPLSVRQNIGYGLLGRLSGAERRQRVDRLMGAMGLERLADRLPAGRSGGEKQRVALARALAIEPRVLVFDEPVSALDESTRDLLCRELKRLQRETGTTTLHVCHNFTEMLAVADRTGVMEEGRLVQEGTPREILCRPTTVSLARFVQAGNLLPAQSSPDGPCLRVTCPGGQRLWAAVEGAPVRHGPVTVMVRPEHIGLERRRPAEPAPGTALLEGSVADVVQAGPVVRVSVDCGAGLEMLVSLGRREYDKECVGVGERVCLAIAAADVELLES